ncbi:hypothetical protein V8G69_02780 [Gaetbulibacter sp. M235]|uniref:hypothetical protein n=1 Tax=Gaetbulibacter sp. M235 TaxID=3126510 RepID=UPI00374EC3AB
MNKNLSLLFLIFISISSYAQNSKSDFLVTKENDTIFCKVVGLKGKQIEFIQNGENKSKKKNIFNFLDLKIADLSVIENPLNLQIEKPENGYAHVYLYRPYVYTGSALACKVEYNGEKLVNLKTYSYYLHKIKAGEIHKYNWNNSKKDILEIDAVNGEIYFIRGSFGASFEPWNTISTVRNGMNIFLDNPNTSKYAILTMKEVSPNY